MKKGWFIAAFIYWSAASFGQQQPLTLDVLKTWPQIDNEQISNDGKFVVYNIEQGDLPGTLVIAAVDKRWITKIPDVNSGTITENSRWVIYKKSDSLFAYDLQKHRPVLMAAKILSFKTPAAGNGRWLAWQHQSPEHTLVLYDLQQHTTSTFEHTQHYQFSNNGEVLLLCCKANNKEENSTVIKWITLTNAKVVTVMSTARNARNFVFDEAATQLAFITDEPVNGGMYTALQYYGTGMDSAVARAKGNVPGLDTGYTVANGNLKFSPDGGKLFFPVRKMMKSPGKKPGNMPDINIWHYNDDYLQSEQAAMLNLAANRTCTAVLMKGEPQAVQLDREKDEPFIELGSDGNSDVVLVKQHISYFSGAWKAATTPAFYAVNIKTGQRKLVVTGRELSINVSPAGKYVIWFDPAKKNYFSYHTTTGEIKNITASLNLAWLPETQPMRLEPFLPFGIAGWLANDEGVLLYDQFDIWKIDPRGEYAPVNLTNGYGRLHHIVLRIWNRDNNDYATPVLDNNGLVLVAFDNVSKNNGFFKKNLNEPGDPIQLTLGPYVYYAHYRFNLQFLTKYSMMKAKNAEGYLLRRMSAGDYPNLCFTRDFKTFTPLSHECPERNYNWLTAELISWKQPDGLLNQGILYKPQNFDPKKKYPVIFYFYEKLSHRLHQFIQPEYNSGSINIPWFVSNGYLVCTPDILFSGGNPGQRICNSVISAARYLAAFPWVDTTKMGLQGHSFGGYEVNYLLTHTSMFAAAQESAGACDLISYYNGFYREHSAQFYFEYGQGRMGATLWENPDLYIQNSPIFKADKVSTPLLIMHNKEDGEVPFQQGTEWFTALRRLGRKVWMLEYDKEYHSINQLKNKIDFTIRVSQFFNHFLKNEPAPKWLVNGVPAMLKGQESGLEYANGFSEGNTP